MKLYSDASRLCHTLLRLQAGEVLPQKEVDDFIETFALTTSSMGCEKDVIAPLVVLFKLAANHKQVSRQQIIDIFADEHRAKDAWVDFEAKDLIRFLVKDEEELHLKTRWIRRLYQFMRGRYGDFGPIPPALPYLDDSQAAHLEEMIASDNKIPRGSPIKHTPRPILSKEEYVSKIKELSRDPGRNHSCWVLAHHQGQIEDAIGFLRKGNCYLSLIEYATGGPKDRELGSYDYSAYFTQEEIDQLFEEGVNYYVAEAGRRRERDGEKKKGTSGYWKDQYIYAGCLEQDRGNISQAAAYFELGNHISRAARLAIKHDLPEKDYYITKAIDKKCYREFLFLFKDIDPKSYEKIALEIRDGFAEDEKHQAFKYAAALARAIGDGKLAAVYEETSKYFEYVSVP